MTSAVVFAYHDVGVRCLLTLLARGIDVPLVITHPDHPAETIWFDSVAETATEHGIPVSMPNDANDAALFDAVAKLRPDFIFSFYYRHMLPAGLLALATRGAYNMHGSLLPKYRGRVPVNWAVLHGETETGATLHEMAAKPDAGAIVAQTTVPILPDDMALQVFEKVTVAAEQTLWRVLPALVDGSAPRLPNHLSRGSYFGGRKPADGRIDWTQPAQRVYNLVRAVAPPWPGAFCDLTTRDGPKRLIVAAARLGDALPVRMPELKSGDVKRGLSVADNRAFGICGDGRALAITRLLCDGADISTGELAALLRSQ